MKTAKEILQKNLRNQNQSLYVTEPSKLGLRDGFPVVLDAMKEYAEIRVLYELVQASHYFPEKLANEIKERLEKATK